MVCRHEAAGGTSAASGCRGVVSLSSQIDLQRSTASGWKTLRTGVSQDSFGGVTGYLCGTFSITMKTRRELRMVAVSATLLPKNESAARSIAETEYGKVTNELKTINQSINRFNQSMSVAR